MKNDRRGYAPRRPSVNPIIYDRLLVSCHSVLNAIFYLGSLAVVESVKCTDEISCDPSDSLETNALAYLAVYVLYYVIIHRNTSVCITLLIILIFFFSNSLILSLISPFVKQY